MTKMRLFERTVAVALGLAYSVTAYAGGTRPDAAADMPWQGVLPVGIATGKYLITGCDNKPPQELQWCNGYIAAIRDAMYVDGKLLCDTPGISITNWENLRVLVLAYLYRHPDGLEKYAGISIRAALSEAFPCN
jgi:Rap1a immunity proteins